MCPMPCARSVADEMLEILAVADLRVERVVIDDVVAMHAARRGPESKASSRRD